MKKSFFGFRVMSPSKSQRPRVSLHEVVGAQRGSQDREAKRSDPAIQPRVSPYMKTGVITGTPSVFPIVAGLASAAPIVSMRAVRDWHIWNRR
jgi:hypothetical protein